MFALANPDYSVIENTDAEQDSISLGELFPNLHAGSAIRGLRYKEELTQEQLAKTIGISRQHLSKMENGRCHRKRYGKTSGKRIEYCL